MPQDRNGLADDPSYYYECSRVLLEKGTLTACILTQKVIGSFQIERPLWHNLICSEREPRSEIFEFDASLAEQCEQLIALHASNIMHWRSGVHNRRHCIVVLFRPATP